MCLLQKHWCEFPLSEITSAQHASTEAAHACLPKAAARGIERAVEGAKGREREIPLLHWERKFEQDLKPNIVMVAGGEKMK